MPLLDRDSAASARGSVMIRAGAVAVGSRAVLIFGRSGSGKSALALQLMAYGAALVADDVTVLHPRDGGLWLRAPRRLSGLIEARGLGLLAAETATAARAILAVDLDRTETRRLPPAREITLAGEPLPLVHKIEGPHFAPAILQYIKWERTER